MLRISTGFFSLLLLSCFSWPALAAPKYCPQWETILAFSDIVLDGHDALSPSVADRFGPEAAYLKIRYAGLGDDDTRSLLKMLRQQKPKSLAVDDLVAAWHLHRVGYQRLRASGGAEGFDRAISRFGISTVRALLLDGGEDVLMKRLAVLPYLQPGETTGLFARLGGIISASIIDQPDEFKERIVRAAEAHGVSEVAAYVAATESTPHALNDLIARGGWATSKPPFILINMVLAVAGNPLLKPEDAEQESLYRLSTAKAHEPEQDFLLHLGIVSEAAQFDPVTRKVIEAIESGAIRRNGPMDASWLFAYKTAVDIMGRSRVGLALDKEDYYGRRYVGASHVVTIRDVVDRMLAVEALQPYLTGKADVLPPSPEGLSDRIDWPRWTEMATKVRNDAVSPILAADVDTLGIVTELLFAKGDQEALRAFVRQVPSGEARVFVANDFAIRLDRGCASYLYHPTEAATLGGRPIFKFDTE